MCTDTSSTSTDITINHVCSYSALQLVPVNFHQCGYCQIQEKALPSPARLKRCTGCTVVMYCSRACQKAAWPMHKFECGKAVSCPTSRQSDHAGYGSPIALAKAVSDWVEDIHSFAFSFLATTVIYSNGGLKANFGPEQFLVYDLAAVPQSGESNDPASAFRLVRVTVVHKSEVSDITGAGTWEGLQADCKAKATSEPELQDCSCFLGWAPGVCRVAGTGLATFHHEPVYKLHCGETSTLPDWVCDIFRDIATMCVNAINSGLVLRHSRRCCCTCQPHPDVGSVLRLKRRFKWVARANWDWASVDGARLLPKSRSGIPILKIWALYRAL